MDFWQNVGKAIVGAALAIGSFLGYHQPQNLGTAINKPAPRFESSLSLAINATATSSLTMVGGVDGNGTVLTGGMCFTINGDITSLVEDICGTASGTVITNLVRGIDSDGVTSNPALAHSHRVGADIKTTDSPYLVQYYRFLNGIDSLPNPLLYAANVTNASQTTNLQNLASVNYVNSVASSGAANAATGVNGISQLATKAQAAAGTVTGSTGANLVVPNAYLNASSTATTTVPVTDGSGKIDPAFINQNASATYNFLGNTTFASTTVNATATFTKTVSIMQTPTSTTDAANKLYVDAHGPSFVLSTSSIVSATTTLTLNPILIPTSTFTLANPGRILIMTNGAVSNSSSTAGCTQNLLIDGADVNGGSFVSFVRNQGTASQLTYFNFGFTWVSAPLTAATHNLTITWATNNGGLCSIIQNYVAQVLFVGN